MRIFNIVAIDRYKHMKRKEKVQRYLDCRISSTILLRRIMICFSAFCLFACSDSSGTDSKGPRKQIQENSNPKSVSLRRGLPGEPRTLDPQLADDEFSFPVIRDLFEGLTSEGPNGEIRPAVASTWAIDSSGTNYRFTLRENARWSNGDQVKAVEFVNGMRKAVSPANASGTADLLSILKNAASIIAGKSDASTLGVKSIGNNVVEIQLEHPAPYILQILAQPVSAPLHLSQETQLKRSDSTNKAMVSNGPYVMVKRALGSFIEIARNEEYWDKTNVHIPSIRYVIVPSESMELKKYLAGELELTYTIPAPDLDRIRQTHSLEIQVAPILGTLYLAMDTTEPPLMGNRELRQALSMAIEREIISQKIAQGATPAYSFVAVGTKDYSPPKYEWQNFPSAVRIQKAQDLYKRAGFSKERPARIRLFFNSNEGIRRLMVAIAAGWKEALGIETELISDEFRVFLEDRKNRKNWDVIRLGWYADFDDPQSFLEIFKSSSIQNDPGYHNSEFDRLLDAANAEPRNDIRQKMLSNAEQILLQDYPIIPVYFYNTRRLVAMTVGGASISPMNRTYSKFLYWKHPNSNTAP